MQLCLHQRHQVLVPHFLFVVHVEGKLSVRREVAAKRSYDGAFPLLRTQTLEEHLLHGARLLLDCLFFSLFDRLDCVWLQTAGDSVKLN